METENQTNGSQDWKEHKLYVLKTLDGMAKKLDKLQSIMDKLITELAYERGKMYMVNALITIIITAIVGTLFYFLRG